MGIFLRNAGLLSKNYIFYKIKRSIMFEIICPMQGLGKSLSLSLEQFFSALALLTLWAG